jgi:uncharacterized DUF497 family protein
VTPCKSASDAGSTEIPESSVPADPIIHRVAETLFAAHLPLGGLHTDMHQKRLNLLQFTAGLMAKTVTPWTARCSAALVFRNALGLVYAVLYIQMRVSWDAPKSRSNQRKHGISFDTASQVLLDPLHLSRQDRVVEGEERWGTIGMVNGVLLILVAYTVVDEKEEVLRIISARRVTRRERIEYEEASQI